MSDDIVASSEISPEGFLEAPRFPFPIAEAERTRWDIVHRMLTITMDKPESSIIPVTDQTTQPYAYSDGAAEAVRAAMKGGGKAVLDVGAGTGAWATAMATRFPDSQVTGIDLVIPPPSRQNNVKFQYGNANLRLNFADSSFDVVHARMIDHGIRHYHRFLSEVARVLRPGGVFLVCMGILSLFDINGVELPTVGVGEPKFNGFQNLLTAIASVVYAGRGAPVTRNRWVGWLRRDGYFSASQRNSDITLQIGPNDESDNVQGVEDVKELALRDASALIQPMRATLLRAGLDATQVMELVTDAERQMETADGSFYSRWASAYGVRSGKNYTP